jgi:hypothetical protein
MNLINVACAAEGCAFSGLVPKCPEAGCGWTEFWCLVDNLFSYALNITLALAVLAIVYGGFLFITAGGSASRIKSAYNAILAAVIGVAIVYGAKIIINLVSQAILGGPIE